MITDTVSHTSHQCITMSVACKTALQRDFEDYTREWQEYRTEKIADSELLWIIGLQIRTLEERYATPAILTAMYKKLLNYTVIALAETEGNKPFFQSLERALIIFNALMERATDLMEKKNHDYGEAWRQMRTTSMTDLILMKIRRVKQIDKNHGTIISEGIDANYHDIINYSLFALILLSEENQ